VGQVAGAAIGLGFGSHFLAVQGNCHRMRRGTGSFYQGNRFARSGACAHHVIDDQHPALQGRAADGVTHASAWVNLLSIYALSNFPSHGTYSASKAAAYSLSQCLRAEMRPSGIRVVHVFPGPIDDEWNQNMPPPKLSPEALASAVIKALRDGTEDVYPGDVAQEWLQRWRDNPKVLEREIAAGGT
jgi:NAD(P)-dependent dehydrogenase (short-subunit alcohol dehydrogenase family)